MLLVLGRHLEGPHFWQLIGWIGVDLFFVLSGFLISGLLFAEYRASGGIGWKRFFIRRGFKIYPSYYAMILATFLWQVADHQQIQGRLYISELFLYQNYAPHIWLHTWSLAVEEHFYIFLPLVLLLLIRLAGRDAQPFRKMPYLCLLVSVACLLQRLYIASRLPDLANSFGSVFYPSHLRFDSLFFGVFLGYLHHFHLAEVKRFLARPAVRILLLLVSAILILPSLSLPITSRFLLSFGLTTLYLGFGGILALSLYGRGEGTSVAPSRLPKLGIAALLAYIGKYSYSIYLWHIFITQHDQWFFRRLWPGISGLWLFAANIVTQLAVGIALSLAIEWPMLNLRDRWFPSLQPSRPSPQPAAPSGAVSPVG